VKLPTRLVDGYRAFVDTHSPLERSRYHKLAETGQRPEVMVICCCDSRVSAEVIFDAHPGEMFVVRNIAKRTGRSAARCHPRSDHTRNRCLARETRTIPVVFVTVTDPIGGGYIASLAHPGANITGFTVDDSALGSKWVEILKEIAPRTVRVTLLFNPSGPSLQFFMPSIQAAALSFKVQVSAATVHAKDEIEGVIAAQARDPVGGLIVMPNAFNTTNVN
jgi:ABC transporter substrate binding protein/Carbonic anhydrase